MELANGRMKVANGKLGLAIERIEELNNSPKRPAHAPKRSGVTRLADFSAGNAGPATYASFIAICSSSVLAAALGNARTIRGAITLPGRQKNEAFGKTRKATLMNANKRSRARSRFPAGPVGAILH
jgi:hypothetical protein